MVFDYKKEFKEFYMPPKKPEIIEMPSMNFAAVRGMGDPNEEDGAYKRSVEMLYGILYTIKMSNKGSHKIAGFFEFVVPPLEGFWWQADIKGMDYTRKDKLEWISVLRLPDFITKEEFNWAISEATKKKKKDFSKVEFFTYNEGLCVQCMHIGPYDNEPETIKMMEEYATDQGYDIDITDKRYHHEIYLSDPRKSNPEKQKTVIRHPLKKRK